MGGPRVIPVLLFRHSKQLHRRGKHGRNDNPTAELYWRLGMRYAIDRLEPEKILLYGDAIPFFDFSGIEVVTYKNSNAERMKKWAEEDQAQAQDVADMAAEGEALPLTFHP